jgi:hypothetical protein
MKLGGTLHRIGLGMAVMFGIACYLTYSVFVIAKVFPASEWILNDKPSGAIHNALLGVWPCGLRHSGPRRLISFEEEASNRSRKRLHDWAEDHNQGRGPRPDNYNRKRP